MGKSGEMVEKMLEEIISELEVEIEHTSTKLSLLTKELNTKREKYDKTIQTLTLWRSANLNDENPVS